MRHGLFRVAVRGRLVRLPDLPAEPRVAIAAQLAEDDELAAALACCRLCEAAMAGPATERCG
jgi:hypothetical protein